MGPPGMVYLDEIGVRPLALQAKLLHVLQDFRFSRVGGVTPIDVNARVINATNRQLEEAMARGDFREDLYYRLECFPHILMQSVDVQVPDQFEKAFAAMMQARANALLVTADGTHQLRQAWFVDFAARRRLPALYHLREYAEAGGLMSYGASVTDNYRRAAAYVDKILRGRSPLTCPLSSRQSSS